MLSTLVQKPFWKSYGLVIARVIVAALFLMAAYFKFSSIGSTAENIEAVGIPRGLLFAWIAAFFEVMLGYSFLTGSYFKQASLLAAAYILFLAIMFHGPPTWAANQDQFGFFVDHFIFIAGLLYMVAHGPGEKWILKKRDHAI